MDAAIEASPSLEDQFSPAELEAYAEKLAQIAVALQEVEGATTSALNPFEELIRAEQTAFDISQLSSGVEKERAKAYEEFLRLKLSGADFFKDLDDDEIGRLSDILALQRDTNEELRRKNELRKTFNLKEGEEFTPLQQATADARENDATGFSGGFNEEFRDSFLLGMEEMTAAAANPGKAFGDSMAQAVTAFSEGLAQTITQAIVSGDSVTDKFKSVARTFATSIIQGLVQIGVQMVLTKALGSQLNAAGTAEGVASGARTYRSKRTCGSRRFGGYARRCTSGRCCDLGLDTRFSGSRRCYICRRWWNHIRPRRGREATQYRLCYRTANLS